MKSNTPPENSKRYQFTYAITAKAGKNQHKTLTVYAICALISVAAMLFHIVVAEIGRTKYN